MQVLVHIIYSFLELILYRTMFYIFSFLYIERRGNIMIEQNHIGAGHKMVLLVSNQFNKGVHYGKRRNPNAECNRHSRRNN